MIFAQAWVKLYDLNERRALHYLQQQQGWGSQQTGQPVHVWYLYPSPPGNTEHIPASPTQTHTQKKTFNLLNAKLCTKHSRETCKYTVLVTKKDALLNLLWGLHTQTRWLEKYEVYNKKQHHFTAIGSIKISGIWCLLNAAHIESRISLPITG